MEVEIVDKKDHERLLSIWEASVRATHDFLTEEYLRELKPLILEQYFNMVDLRCVKSDSGEILGFCGIHEGSMEMLFISPDAQGKGLGSMLMNYAINTQGVRRVDVNEQNRLALGFYQHIGFKVTGRSPVDGQGKAYPLLHMEL